MGCLTKFYGIQTSCPRVSSASKDDGLNCNTDRRDGDGGRDRDFGVDYNTDFDIDSDFDCDFDFDCDGDSEYPSTDFATQIAHTKVVVQYKSLVEGAHVRHGWLDQDDHSVVDCR